MRLQVALTWDKRKPPEYRRPFRSVCQKKGKYQSIFDVDIKVIDSIDGFPGDISGLLRGRDLMETYIAKLDKAAGNKDRISPVPYQDGVRDITALSFHEVPGRRGYEDIIVIEEAVAELKEDLYREKPRHPLHYLTEAVFLNHFIRGQPATHFDYLAFWRDDWKPPASNEGLRNIMPYADFLRGHILELYTQFKTDLRFSFELVTLDTHGLPFARMTEERCQSYPGLWGLVNRPEALNLQNEFDSTYDDSKWEGLLDEAGKMIQSYVKNNSGINRIFV